MPEDEQGWSSAVAILSDQIESDHGGGGQVMLYQPALFCKQSQSFAA